MKFTLKISSAALSDEEMNTLTRQLAQTISRETDISTEIPEHQSEAGVKGDPITIGVLALSFLSSGAAVALIEVLKTYLGRASSLTFEAKRPDGSQMKISAENMKPEQMQDTVARLSSFLGK
jgi:hypothetical protein